MLPIKFQAEPLKPCGFLRIQFVRTADVVTKLQQQPGNPTHSAAGDADQVNTMALSSQKFSQVGIFRHDWVNFSIVIATRFAASPGASCNAFSDIRRSCSG